MSRAPNGQTFKTPLTTIGRLTKRPNSPLPMTDSVPVPYHKSSQLVWQAYWDAEYARQTRKAS